MMASLTNALADIDEALLGLGRQQLLQALRPGLNVDRTAALFDEARLPRSGPVETLYAWRNGTETSGVESLDDIQLFPGFYFLSIQDAVKNYQSFLPDERWQPGWLPLFANGGGDFYVVELSGDMVGVVRHFRIDESEHPIEFESICDMIQTIAAAFKRKVIFVDSESNLEMDDLTYAAVAAELNPRVAWWID